jgi:ribose 1,5-bisphosphokinase PhnN
MKIITITGPTCSGKSTVEATLARMGAGRLKSLTTRPIRTGEVAGKDYDFITTDEFAELKSSGNLVESVFFNGNFYAVSAREMIDKLETHKNVAVVVEPDGAAQVARWGRENNIEVRSVWVNCSPHVRASRWMARFMGDLASNDAPRTTMTTYAGRLGAMMSDEQAWIEAARSGNTHQLSGKNPIPPAPYSLIVDSGLYSPEEMAATILEELTQ